jgi:hypothetical protein
MLETPSAAHLDVRYEKSDAKVGAILACGVGLALAVLFVQLAALALFDAFKARTLREDTPLPALAAKERTQLPRDLGRIPGPLLQQDEPMNLERFRREEDRRLNGFGWVDKNAGVVHIPIAEAMRLLADAKFAEARGVRVDDPVKKGARR